MSLHTEWIIWPVVAAAVCTTVWILKWVTSYDVAVVNCPSMDVPIAGIHPPDGGTAHGLYFVTFLPTGSDTPFYLTAQQIVTRCNKHGLPVPSFVAFDTHAASVPKSYLVGNDLVIGSVT